MCQLLRVLAGAAVCVVARQRDHIRNVVLVREEQLLLHRIEDGIQLTDLQRFADVSRRSLQPLQIREALGNAQVVRVQAQEPLCRVLPDRKLRAVVATFHTGVPFKPVDRRTGKRQPRPVQDFAGMSQTVAAPARTARRKAGNFPRYFLPEDVLSRVTTAASSSRAAAHLRLQEVRRAQCHSALLLRLDEQQVRRSLSTAIGDVPSMVCANATGSDASKLPRTGSAAALGSNRSCTRLRRLNSSDGVRERVAEPEHQLPVAPRKLVADVDLARRHGPRVGNPQLLVRRRSAR